MLPKEIVPNPLLSSTVELRLESELDFDYLQNILAQELAKISNLTIDKRTENEGNEDEPTIILKNEDFLVAFQKKSILFENIGSYKLWQNYFQFISTHIKMISEIQEGLALERIGLRYISFFNKEEVFGWRILKRPFLMIEDEINGINNYGFFGAFDFEKNGYKYSVRFSNEVELSDKSRPAGCLIDLDIYKEMKTFLWHDDITTFIDEIHTEEKHLFVSLLNKDYMDSLYIRY